jgi:hypothetical protein
MEVTIDGLQPSKNGHYRLLPNINRSGRVLPDGVTPEDLQGNTLTDRERPIRKLKDRELYAFLTEVSGEELAKHPGLELEVHFADRLFAVLDQSGRLVPGGDKPPVRIPLFKARRDGTKGEIQFYLEAASFWGSPLLAQPAPRGVTFRFVEGGVTVAEQTRFRGYDLVTADVILLGDDAPAERLYICDVDQNGPSLLEAAEAARAAAVPLTIVPLTVNVGDSWVQDQFQVGYTATHEGTQRVIVHLPRMKHDAALVPGTPNLRNFTDSHFPSETVGVLKDFWTHESTLSDGVTSFGLGVAESYVLYKHLARVVRLLRLMFRLIQKVDEHATPKLEGNDFTDLFRVRQAVDEALVRLLRYRPADVDVQNLIRGFPATVREISGYLAGTGKTVKLTVQVKAGETSEVRILEFGEENKNALRAFYRELQALHSSGNHGGNIEVSPPIAGAIYGKIITGSMVYPPLTEFLTSRGTLHPRCTVYTAWLDVGHIDEIMAFAKGGGGGFSVFRADPMLALTLLDRAVALQKKGVLVTRLFRGKKWNHERVASWPEPKLPPRAYAALLGPGSPYDLTGLGTVVREPATDTYGHAAFHDDRRFLLASNRATVSARYAAFMSCADLLASCGATNRAIDALFLSNKLRSPEDFLPRHFIGDLDVYRNEALPFRLDTVLEAEFRGVPVHPLPVLFDSMENFVEGTTQAIIPAAANLQTLGRHLLVPRPYGPRMRAADAVTLMTELAQSGRKVPAPSVGYIQSRGLDRTWHWTRAGENVYVARLAKWASTFDPQFEEMHASMASAIAASTTSFELESIYHLLHAHDPLANHPEAEPETLYRIAGYFKDGFDEFRNYPVAYCDGDTAKAHPRQDKYEADIQKVMDRIRQANPAVFDATGNVLSKDWIKIAIPEATVDLFELYTQLVIESLGLTVQWVDSWYYHVHGGGIHCGTNVLRSPA